MIRRMFFLKKKWVLATAMAGIYCWLRWETPWNWVMILLAALILWLSRRRSVVWLDTLKSDGEIFLSPIDGEVAKIGTWTDPEGGVVYGEIRLRLKYSNHWGLYLPSSSEMAFLKQYPGPYINRKLLGTLDHKRMDESEHTDLTLKLRNGVMSRMRFIHCEFGKSPKIWMKSGDRGRGAACFGYYPFGGSLIVYVPWPSDVLVVENEKITAGQTVLAVFKTRE